MVCGLKSAVGAGAACAIAPILAMGSGLPLGVFTSSFNPNIGIGGQSFGEADAVNFASFEQAVRMCPNNFGSSRNNNMPTAGGFGTNGFVDANGNAPGLFSNPAAAYSCFRNPILGLDGQNGGTGILRGLPFWNVDFQVRKNIHITERFSAEFQTVFTNVFNHVQLFDPLLVMGDPADWGALPGQVNTPRQMEFGLRVRF